jgi:hypothetical protein
MDRGWVVLIKIPEPLISWIDALKSESVVWQLTMMGWSSSNNFLASFLFFTSSLVIGHAICYRIDNLYFNLKIRLYPIDYHTGTGIANAASTVQAILFC